MRRAWTFSNTKTTGFKGLWVRHRKSGSVAVIEDVWQQGRLWVYRLNWQIGGQPIDMPEMHTNKWFTAKNYEILGQYDQFTGKDGRKYNRWVNGDYEELNCNG